VPVSNAMPFADAVLQHWLTLVHDGSSAARTTSDAPCAGACVGLDLLKPFVIACHAGKAVHRICALPQESHSFREGCLRACWAMCRYTRHVDYDQALAAVRSALGEAFWGPPALGVYSPSVQYTLFQMAKLALKRSAPPSSAFKRPSF